MSGEASQNNNSDQKALCTRCAAEDQVSQHIQEKVVRALSRLVEQQMKEGDLWGAFEQIPELARLVAGELVRELQSSGKADKPTELQEAIAELLRQAEEKRQSQPTLIVELNNAVITSGGISFGDYCSER